MSFAALDHLPARPTRKAAVLIPLALFGTVMLFACSDAPLPPAAGLAPGHLSLNIVSGNQQVAAPGAQLPSVLVVQALTSTGTPIAGQVINFRVTSGGGSVFAGVGLTNSQGYAQDYWTLGPLSGANTLEARAVDPTTGQKLVFATFTATAANVATVAVSPASGSVLVGATLQLTATATDSAGNVLSVPFAWTTTNSGVATVSSSGLVTGVAAGSATITASVSGKSGSTSITVSAPSTSVASVAVSPKADTITAGQTKQLTDTVKNSSGTVVSGTTTTWASSNTAVATVSSSGVLTAMSAGTTTITATVSGVVGSNTTTVTASTTSGNGQPSLTPGFFNMPSGMMVLSDVDFSTLSNPGTTTGSVAGTWYYQPNTTFNYPPWGTLATDSASPSGNSTVFQFSYPVNWPGGEAPALVRPPGLPDNTHKYQEFYWGFYWKADSGWQNHPSNVNKVAFGWLNGSSTFGMTWHWWSGVDIYGDTIPPQSMLVFGFGSTVGSSGYITPNQKGLFSLKPGNWYKVEWYMKLATSSTSNDGIVKLWVNDHLMMSYSNRSNSGYFSDLYFDPVWGGTGGAKTQNDFFRIAHAKVAVR